MANIAVSNPDGTMRYVEIPQSAADAMQANLPQIPISFQNNLRQTFVSLISQHSEGLTAETLAEIMTASATIDNIFTLPTSLPRKELILSVIQNVSKLPPTHLSLKQDLINYVQSNF